MPWPTGSTTRDKTLEDVDLVAAQLKANCVRWRGLMLNQSVGADFVLFEVLRTLIVSRDRFNGAQGVPGIAAFVADARSVTIAEVTAAFSDMVAAVNAAIGNIVSSMPRTGGAATATTVLFLAAGGIITYRAFTTADTAGLRTALSAIEATIADTV